MQFLVGLRWMQMWCVKSRFQFLCSVAPSRYFLWCSCDGWVTDLTSENSSLVRLIFILIYFLPYKSLVCESWSSVLIGLLLHFWSFHLAVESAGNPASIIRGKNVEVIVVVVWSETDIMTWAWNFKMSSIHRSSCTGVLLENEIVSFFSSLKFEAVKINCNVRRLLIHFFFWKILHGLISNLYEDTCFLKFILQILYAQWDSGLQ